MTEATDQVDVQKRLVDVLDELALPFTKSVFGKFPPDLNKIFALVVAGGWAPRHPAFGGELLGLERCYSRGDCIAPLLIEDDEIFFDQNMPPRSGDVVTFTLGARGAEAQNSSLPPGQPRWAKGDRWAKLYVRWRGYDMLLDRYGSSMTATLAACESPDDVPHLAPIRQVRRAGLLLFGPPTPDMHSVQIEANGATFVAENTAASTTIAVSPTITTVLSQTVGSFPVAASVVVTCTGEWQFNTGASSDSYLLSAGIAQIFGGGPFFGVLARSPTGTVQAASSTNQGAFAREQTFALAANTAATYDLEAIGVFGSPATSTFKILNATLKTEVILR